MKIPGCALSAIPAMESIHWPPARQGLYCSMGYSTHLFCPDTAHRHLVAEMGELFCSLSFLINGDRREKPALSAVLGFHRKGLSCHGPIYEKRYLLESRCEGMAKLPAWQCRVSTGTCRWPAVRSSPSRFHLPSSKQT